MSHPSDNEPDTEPRGADGWVDDPSERRPYVDPDSRGPTIDLDGPAERPLARREPEMSSQRGRGEGHQPDEDPVQRGKPMAVLSHMSILFGLPVFLIPLIKRDNAFALHHAKSAMVIFLLFLAGFVASFVTCGLAVPFVLLLYVPAIVGVVHAARGELAGHWALGHLGERFIDLEVIEEDSPETPPRRDRHEETGQSRPNR